jgi:hypothetical protein
MGFEEYYLKKVMEVEGFKIPRCPQCERTAIALCYGKDERPPELRVCKCGYEFWKLKSRYDLLLQKKEFNA